MEFTATASPGRKRAVASGTGSKGVSASLDSSIVVARGYDNGVDAIHDPFVVGRGAVGIEFSEAGGLLDRCRNPLGSHLQLNRIERRLGGGLLDETLLGHVTLDQYPAAITEIGQDSETEGAV